MHISNTKAPAYTTVGQPTTSAVGTFRTWPDVRLESGVGAIADIARQRHLARDTAAPPFASATVRIELVNLVLPRDDLGCLPFAAYGKPGVSADFSQKKAALKELLRQSGPRDVPFAVLSELVRFRDINKKSLVAAPPDDLAASFGPGVELKRVILELTNDPVTPPPEIWPHWLKVKNQNAEFRGD
jgi:hypothetical protein